MNNAAHIPVLSKEAINSVVTNSEGLYLDVTAGFGGHTKLILERLTKKGRLIASDIDQDSVSYMKSQFSDPDQQNSRGLISNQLLLIDY